MNAIFKDLENKIVLITGASRGIGRGIAETLATQGAHVVFNYRGDESQANELKDRLISLGAKKVSALNFDVTDTNKMKTELDNFVKENGPISGLVNNAGISKDNLALRVNEEQIEQLLNVNLKAVMLLTNHLARQFLKATDVSIVNMSSVVGLMGNTAQTVYASTKAGLIGYTKSLAKELASRNIRCNAICPGFIETEMTKQLPEKVQEEYKKAIPIHRYGECGEVADLVCFLLSKSSSYITGETIKIDGGLYI